MAGKTARKVAAQGRRVVAHPAGTTAPISVDAIIRGGNHSSNRSSGTNHKGSDAALVSPAAPISPTAELADHLAQVLTGKKKLAPTPEFLDLEAKVKKAWAEGYRGFEKREVRERDELFQRPVLKVEIGGYGAGVRGPDGEFIKDADGKVKRKYYGPGRVIVDRLDELAAAEGYTVG